MLVVPSDRIFANSGLHCLLHHPPRTKHTDRHTQSNEEDTTDNHTQQYQLSSGLVDAAKNAFLFRPIAHLNYNAFVNYMQHQTDAQPRPFVCLYRSHENQTRSRRLATA